MDLFGKCLNFLLLISFSLSIHGELDRRPFYLIAHMMETIEETDKAFAEGANAVEVDVRFTTEGEPIRLNHGFPCDCFRNCFSSQDISPYLVHLRDMGIPGSSVYNSNICVIYLDLKLRDVATEHLATAGKNLALLLLDNIYQNGNSEPLFKFVIGIPRVKQRNFIIGFIKGFESHNGFLKNIGFEFSDNEDLQTIEKVVKNLKLTNVWQGRGRSNCFPQTDKAIREAIHVRDIENSYVDKVYSWTIDNSNSLRNYLRLSIDGIITNRVSKMLSVLKEPEFANSYRLATNSDDPWQKIKGNGAIISRCKLNLCWKDCSYKGDVCFTNGWGCFFNGKSCNILTNCSFACFPTLGYFV